MLEGVGASLKEVGESVVAMVEKVSGAVEPHGKKRKRGKGEDEGEVEGRGGVSAPIR